MGGPTFVQALSAREIQVSDAARDELARLLAQEQDDEVDGIRIYVSGGGCGGMNYGMAFATGASPFDKQLSMQGVDVYVDAVALAYLRGVEIDYVADDLGAKFIFKNAFQATGGSGTCGGCGAAQG